MRLLLVTFCLVFAGCADDGAPDDVKFCDSEDCRAPAPTDTKGVILGVVVNEAIQPVAGATVALTPGDLATETDEEGRFSFGELDPGTYFLEISRIGYATAQQSADVVAGVTPGVLKILLESDPTNIPYVEVYSFSGFVECMVGIQETPVTVGSSSFNPCFASPNSRNVVSYEVGSATFAQSETVWSPGLGVGESLLVSYAVPDASHTDGQNDYASVEGSSPLVLTANETMLEQVEASEAGLNIRVFAGGEGGFSVHANEEFDTITHVFYGFTPPEGWTFVRDGSPAVPT